MAVLALPARSMGSSMLQLSAARFTRIVRNRLTTVRRAAARSALVVGLVLTIVAPAPGFFSSPGAITGSEPVQSGRPSRDLIPDACEASDFDGTAGLGIVFRYDLYSFTNRTESDLCIRAQVDVQAGCAPDWLHAAAYVPSFAPTSIESGFVGSSNPGAWTFRVPARSPFDFNVHETVAGQGCSGYFLSLDSDKHFNLAQPEVSGTPAVGASVAAGTGTWAGANRAGPPTVFAYAWRRCNAAGADCANTGVTGSTYHVGTGDVGSTLQVLVTAGPPGSTQNSAASAPTSTVPSVTTTAALSAAPSATTGSTTGVASGCCAGRQACARRPLRDLHELCQEPAGIKVGTLLLQLCGEPRLGGDRQAQQHQAGAHRSEHPQAPTRATGVHGARHRQGEVGLQAPDAGPPGTEAAAEPAVRRQRGRRHEDVPHEARAQTTGDRQGFEPRASVNAALADERPPPVQL